MSRIFLLSPANSTGARGRMLLSERARSRLAVDLRTGAAPLGDVFSFMSGLYFRGKLAYATAFARPPEPRSRLVGSGVFVITPGAGLRSPDTMVNAEIIQMFGRIDVDAANPAYRIPLQKSARAVARAIEDETEVVLLGSIASAKYVDVLTGIFERRLLFPADFVGRGDMSRGGLMLRCVQAGRELEYVPVLGAVRHGQRPPRLAPLPRRTG
jgi:hypothetical protein